MLLFANRNMEHFSADGYSFSVLLLPLIVSKEFFVSLLFRRLAVSPAGNKGAGMYAVSSQYLESSNFAEWIIMKFQPKKYSAARAY